MPCVPCPAQPIKKPEDATADVTNEAEARVPEKPEGTRAIVTKETENRPPTQPRSPIKTRLQTAQSSDHPIDLTCEGDVVLSCN